jgi:guanylate kinase
MDLAKDYDARVVNDDLATAVRDLANVLESYEMDGGNS